MGYEISKDAKCAVIGYGSWATALVKIILENETSVGWHIRSSETMEYICENKSNPRYLRAVHFDTERLIMSSDINEVVEQADVIVLAIPSAFLKTTLEPLRVSLENKFVVSAIKGIVPDDYITIAEYMNQHYNLPFDQIGIITGPCHAEEVAMERLSYLTMVCKDIDNAHTLGEKFRSKYINTSYSTDIYGTEYAAVLKNIYAIAVGIAHGLRYGDNFIAVLICNGAMEMSRFMSESYPAERDTNSSAYLGDLLVTAYSQFSRNRTFGMMIGKGYSVKTAQFEMNQIAEGYYAAECIMQVNKAHNIPMPIAEAVYDILYKNEQPAVVLKRLTKKLI